LYKVTQSEEYLLNPLSCYMSNLLALQSNIIMVSLLSSLILRVKMALSQDRRSWINDRHDDSSQWRFIERSCVPWV